MKKSLKYLIVLVSVITSVFLFSGCGVILVTEDGKADAGELTTREFDLDDFTGVDIGSVFRFEIRQADSFSISITAYEDMFDNIDVEKDGDTLVIDTGFIGFHWGVITTDSYPKVVITMPVLETLGASGSTEGTVTGFSLADTVAAVVSGSSDIEFRDISATDFTLTVSGSSDVVVDVVAQDMTVVLSGASELDGTVTAEYMDIEISGSSDIDLDGSATDVKLYSHGASELELDEFHVVNADIKLTEASDCDIFVSGRLDADISGASRLEYYGDPELGDIDVSGAADLDKK